MSENESNKKVSIDPALISMIAAINVGPKVQSNASPMTDAITLVSPAKTDRVEAKLAGDGSIADQVLQSVDRLRATRALHYDRLSENKTMPAEYRNDASLELSKISQNSDQGFLVETKKALNHVARLGDFRSNHEDTTTCPVGNGHSAYRLSAPRV